MESQSLRADGLGDFAAVLLGVEAFLSSLGDLLITLAGDFLAGDLGDVAFLGDLEGDLVLGALPLLGLSC